MLCPYSKVGPSVYPVHCTLYRVYSLQCTVQPPLCTLHCTVYSPVNLVYSIVTYISHGRTEQYSFRLDISQTQLYMQVQSVLQSLCNRVCTTELYRQGLGQAISKAGWELSKRELGVESVARRADCQQRCCQPLVHCGNQKPANACCHQQVNCLFPPRC